MDPEDLAAKFAKKVADAAAKEQRQKEDAEEHRVKVSKLTEEGKQAMEGVVIPYLNELRATFPSGQFALVSTHVDSQDRRPVGVTFKIGNGDPVTISMVFGRVTIEEKSALRAVTFVFPTQAEPFMAMPNDLTREKLGSLIEMIIEKQD